MSVTENLMNEHQFILSYLNLLERYSRHADRAILRANAERFIAFIHEFADSFHHAKEEDILFRYLAAPGVLSHCNPLPQMLFEHGKARESVQAMENALEVNDLTGLATAINQYTQLLKEHIFKEDNILYPMAESGLSETDKTALLADYAEAEQRLDSARIWQKYQSLYAELAGKLG